MGWFGNQEASEEAAAITAGVSLPAQKKITLNFGGLSAAAVRDIGRSTIGVAVAVPDLRGQALNENISVNFNAAAAAFTSHALPQGRRKPPGMGP